MAILASSTRGPATVRDLDDLPEDVVGHIVEGELIVFPRPDPPHVETASELGALLIRLFRHGIGGPGGWIVLHEPKIDFGPDLLVPDLAAWRRERFVSPRRGPYQVTPDWVCEVLSPSTARFDRGTKLPIYAREGAEYAWLVDPERQTLEVFKRHDDAWLTVATHGEDDRVRAIPFEAVELDLSPIWNEVMPESEGGD